MDNIEFKNVDLKKIYSLAEESVKNNNFEATKNLSFEEHVVFSTALTCMTSELSIINNYINVVIPFADNLRNILSKHKNNIRNMFKDAGFISSNIDSAKNNNLYTVTVLGNTKSEFVENYTADEVKTINKFLLDMKNNVLEYNSIEVSFTRKD